MSAPFTITIDDAQVQAALTKLSRHVTNLTPIMEDIGAKLGDLTEDAFQAEGPGWPALKPATVKRRGSVHPILQVSAGGLAASITHGGDATSAWVGASKVYAAVHQFGNPANKMYNRPGGNPAPIPPRPYLPYRDGALTPAAQAEVMDILTDALRAAIGQG